MKEVYVVCDELLNESSGARYIAVALNEAKKWFPNTEFIVVGSKIFGHDFDQIIKSVPFRVAAGYRQRDVSFICKELEKIANGRMVLAFTIDDIWPSEADEQLNFCFGIAHGNVIVQSLARYRELADDELKRVVTQIACHELGHVYGAAMGRTDPRGGIYDNHCTDENCCMCQCNSVKELRSLAIRTNNARRFCKSCQNDIAESAPTSMPNQPSKITYKFEGSGS